MVSSRPHSGDGGDALALLVLDQLQPKSPAQGLVFAPCHKCILPAGGRAAGLYQYAVTCLGFQTDSAQEKLLKHFCVIFFFF